MTNLPCRSCDTNGAKMESELLISEVKKYPQLYDARCRLYKDNMKKEDIWEHIGVKLGMSGGKCMRKWKDIRDSFVKSRRRTMMGLKNGKEVREYKYSKELEFLLPHIRTREGSISIAGDYYMDGKEEDEALTDNRSRDVTDNDTESATMVTQDQLSSAQQRETPSESSEYSSRKSKRRLVENEDMLEHDCGGIMCSSDGKFRKGDDDEDDIFFKSMALVCKRLPQRAKSTIKFEIHKLIHEAEIELLATAPTHSYLVIPDGRCPTPISSCSVPHNSAQHHGHHEL